MINKDNLNELSSLFSRVRDFDSLLDLCECARAQGASAILTDEEGGRPFNARHIFTCEGSGIVISDDDWNCVAFTEHNLISTRPISNDYNVFTVGIITSCEIYPRLDEDDDSSRSLVKLSLIPKSEKPVSPDDGDFDDCDDDDCDCDCGGDHDRHDHGHHHDCGCGHDHGHDCKCKDEPAPRSDDFSYQTYDLGLNRLFTGMYDLEGLEYFCDAAMAVMDATSDEDEAMVLLSINARVQDPMAHCFNVAKLSYKHGLTLIAEDDDGEELRLALTEDRVASVERIACVNNSFYCAQILLERMPGETKANYLQLAVFL